MKEFILNFGFRNKEEFASFFVSHDDEYYYRDKGRFEMIRASDYERIIKENEFPVFLERSLKLDDPRYKNRDEKIAMLYVFLLTQDKYYSKEKLREMKAKNEAEIRLIKYFLGED